MFLSCAFPVAVAPGPVGATTFMFPCGEDASPQASAATKGFLISYPGFLKFFEIRGDAAPGVGQSEEVDVFVNGVQKIALTLGAADTAKSDRTTLVKVAVGDVVTFRQVSSGTAATVNMQASVVYFVGPNPCG